MSLGLLSAQNSASWVPKERLVVSVGRYAYPETLQSGQAKLSKATKQHLNSVQNHTQNCCLVLRMRGECATNLWLRQFPSENIVFLISDRAYIWAIWVLLVSFWGLLQAKTKPKEEPKTLILRSFHPAGSQIMPCHKTYL